MPARVLSDSHRMLLRFLYPLHADVCMFTLTQAHLTTLRLTNVYLSSATYYPRRPIWTTLSDILDPLINLKALELTDVYCSGELLLNDTVLEMALPQKERKCLESFTVLEHPGISDRGLAAIANAAGATLTTLVCSGSAWITDKGAEELAQKCPHLTHLSLAACVSITDAAVEAVAKGCPQLMELNLSRCSRLTMVGLHTIESTLHRLQRLVL